jgi:hypothetical protein
MPKIAMVAYFASCGAAWAVDLPTTADGWKVIGLSPAAEVFWIRPSLIRGLAMDRRVPLAIATPSKGVELSTAHIDCGELVFYRVLQDGPSNRTCEDRKWKYMEIHRHSVVYSKPS